ncbi:DUF3310 domain-containing protein [Paenibacillus azoreducens]|uniref:DUF3310 domain-containing protein n=1 Tax=Paenibacillus azoreducens TaxID=116718 RepID=UPI001F3D5936|nr:DUF3310 domain-containing protein [Paenibacillus azoreducens]
MLQKPSDPVNHPGHYTRGGIECIDAIEAATTAIWARGVQYRSRNQIPLALEVEERQRGSTESCMYIKRLIRE